MSTFDGTFEHRLHEEVTGLMARAGVPGVAVGILHRGESVAFGYGVTSVEHPLPVTDETLFQIGSITKTFTGTAIMQLVEEGVLDLDAKVRTYVPDFRVRDETASREITLRQLLTHEGGWAGDFFHGTGAGDDAIARYVADMAELPQVVPIGTHWSYNNAGFSVAGYAIERATGKRYETVLSEQVLVPLGLEHTFFDPGDVITHSFAVGHIVVEGKAQVARPWALERAIYPAGGITCHVKDLLRYARFHLGDGRAENGTRLLSLESLTMMHSPQVTLWEGESWGLSWGIVDEIEGARQVRHGGGTKGQLSLLVLVPEHDLAVVILTNADRGGLITDEVRRWALKELLGLEAPRAKPLDDAEEELAQYAGQYRGYFTDLDLGVLGGKLIGQVTYKRGFPNEDVPPPPAPPPMSVALCEKDRLLVLDGPAKDALGDVIRKPDGSLGWLRFSGRLHEREDIHS
jgi:CubicO group peptidase (beta-lactamase class C family)